MQPLLMVIASAVGFAITVWIVRKVLRTIFPAQAQTALSSALIAAGIWLFVLRAVTVAIPLLILGTVLLLRENSRGSSGPTTKTSKVRSIHLEMTLDHETGTIDGRILRGKRQGQVLSALTLQELLSYHAEVQADEESVKLFETFLDGAHPAWRDQNDASSAYGEEASPLSRQLSLKDAYQLLGLEAGCSDEDIRKAFHRLIKRVHPDSGGSAALATQITKARDRLLGERQ